MAQLADDLTRAQELAAQLKDEIHRSSVLLETVTFVYNLLVGEVLESRVRLLLDMDVLPSLVHIIKSREDLKCSEIALKLVDIFLLVADDQLPEIVDVNLVKTLIAKLQERDFAFDAASALATIVVQSEDLSQMIRRHGFMDAVLVAAGNCRSDDDVEVFTGLLAHIFDIHMTLALWGIHPETKADFFWMILLEVHAMFERNEFDDSPESMERVLPLVQYLLESSEKVSSKYNIVCSVLMDFFRRPLPAKARHLWRLNLARNVTLLIESRDQGVASKAITCVASLAGSGPLLTDQLLSRGVVRKLAIATKDKYNDEGVCLALRELVRHGGSSVMSSLDTVLYEWVESRHDSKDKKVRLAACTALVCMMHAEDALPGRFQVTLGSLVGELCKILEKSPTPSDVESVLTHLAIALDTVDKHLSAVYASLIKSRDNWIKVLRPYIHDRKLYTSKRAGALLDRLRDLKRPAMKRSLALVE